MAKIDLDIPSLGSKFIDLRDTLPGDAYTWSWERDLSRVNYLAIHHTGGPDNQTPQEVADYHINTNGWGGIGYHFLIDKDGIVYYVGDISTARANVADLNEAVIGICLIGNFIDTSRPTTEQLNSAHRICEFLIELPDLINVKSWDKLFGHKELPDQATDCPGDDWNKTKAKIISGPPVNSGEIVFNQVSTPGVTSDQQEEIDSLQVNLATVNTRLISCQEALQAAEAKVNFAEKPEMTFPSMYEILKPYLPYVLIAVSAMLALIVNLNLLGLFLNIQPDALLIDIIFSTCLGALIYIYLKKLTR